MSKEVCWSSWKMNVKGEKRRTGVVVEKNGRALLPKISVDGHAHPYILRLVPARIGAGCLGMVSPPWTGPYRRHRRSGHNSFNVFAPIRSAEGPATMEYQGHRSRSRVSSLPSLGSVQRTNVATCQTFLATMRKDPV